MLLAIERQGGRRRIALYVLRHSGIIRSSCIYPRRVCVSKESCSSRLTRKRVKIWGETERERERDMSNAAREIEQAQNNESDMSTCTCTYLCIILSVYVHICFHIRGIDGYQFWYPHCFIGPPIDFTELHLLYPVVLFSPREFSPAPRNVHSALHRYASLVDKCHSSVSPFEGP